MPGPRLIASLVAAAVLGLAGCSSEDATFVTNQEVELHLSQAHDATVTAIVPKGTPVRGLGWVGSECVCWLVATPYGVGFVYTRYLDMHLADIGPIP